MRMYDHNRYGGIMAALKQDTVTPDLSFATQPDNSICEMRQRQQWQYVLMVHTIVHNGKTNKEKNAQDL